LIIGFYNVVHAESPDPITFEIILHEGNSNIELQYADAPSDNDGVPTSVGIENADQTDGLQIFYGDNVPFYNGGFLIVNPCQFRLAGDVNHDCVYNLIDFAITAQNWLIDCNATPGDPACFAY